MQCVVYLQQSIPLLNLSVFYYRMSRKISLLVGLLTFTFTSLRGQNVLLNETFENGIPATFTNSCNDGMNVRSEFFKKGSPKSEWFTSYPGKDEINSLAAYSCSLRQYDKVATDNWLITPQLTINSDDLWLTWDAHSVHHELPESYSVLISTSGTEPEDFSLLFEVEGEKYQWAHHIVSLAAYKGENIFIAFQHHSTNKYLLALDNVFVGEMSEHLFTVSDSTLHSSGDTGTASVHGTFRNDGQLINISSIQCTLGDGNSLTYIPEEKVLKTAEERTYQFDVPVSLGKATKYQVDAVTEGGERFELVSDSIFCTAYPRMLMIDKLSAYWCTNCPSMDLLIFELEERYDDQFAEVNVQYPANNGTDPGKLTCDIFLNNMQTVNLPRAYYNRLMQKPQDNVTQTGILDYAIRRPCNAKVTLESATLNEGKIIVKIKSEFASDIDNSNEKYRIGLTLIEKLASTNSKQANGLTLPSSNEFYFLPSTIQQPMAMFTNVARGTDVAFSGIENSFPEQIEARKSYDIEYTFDVPSGVSNPTANNMAVLAYVLNTTNSEALNADKTDVSESTESAIEKILTSSSAQQVTCSWENNECFVKFPTNILGTITIYTVDGILVSPQVRDCSQQLFNLANNPAGCYIVNTTSILGNQSFKIVKSK